MNTYKILENVVLPLLQNFKEDLVVSDKKTLQNYKGPFLYGIRPNGTNLLKLDLTLPNYEGSVADLQNMMHNNLHSIKYANKRYFYFNGTALNEISWEKMHEIFGIYCKQVFHKKSQIDELKIDELSYVLFNTMYNSRNWKEQIKESDNSELRRIRNNFNFFKFKKTSSLNDAKQQLYKYCNLLN